jgi:GTP diphosphokinase / guanosine-3',5'-bis(diphosphate) 3'-diphosphatase
MSLRQEPITKEELFDSVLERLGPEAREIIEKAYHLSDRMHGDQKRLSGEPYIIHPLNVAGLLNELRLDTAVIAAGLLHDVVEDTEYTKDDMVRDFGAEIANLVEGVTKISEIKSQSKETEAAENIRKMLVATIQDARVIIIKLADKTHNMRTLKFQPPEKALRIAKETLSVYAPIAGRLGMYSIKVELEDLAFQITHPEEFQHIRKSINLKKSEREEYIEKLKIILKQRLSEIHIDAKIEGRAKHFYSIHKKMTTKDKSFHEIFDLRAIRIITDEIRDCYGVLGIVHTLWPPVPGRFKDYVATPKTNFYQSLHTTVIGPDGKPLEVQIRTRDMNRIAEDGVAAHWAYKEGKTSTIGSGIGSGNSTNLMKDNPFRLKWLEILNSWQDSTMDSREFLEDLKFDLHEDEVFIFTPKGEIVEIAKGATVLDFAFRIHTDVGLHAKGAKVNGRMVPLRTELKSGDQVEIQTEKKSKPSPIWLRIVKTASAKQKLKQYFRRLQEENDGRITDSIETPPSEKVIQEIQKNIRKRPRKKVGTEEKEANIIVAGIKDILVRRAACCSPIPGDEIIGFVTRGRGVSVHKKNCPTAMVQMENMQTLPVRWDGIAEPIPVQIEVRSKDVQGIYLSMVESISGTKTNIIEAGATSNDNKQLVAKFKIEIEHLDQLKEILDNLKLLPDVVYAERVKIGK